MKSFFSKILKEDADTIYIQIFRYFFSGGLAFIVDFSLLYLLTDVLNIHYLLSSIISFSVGLTITYLFSIFWVFNERRLNNRTYEFIVFCIIGAVGLGLTSLFMWLFTDLLQIHYLLSKIITTAIVFIWNFIAKKLILFTKRKN